MGRRRVGGLRVGEGVPVVEAVPVGGVVGVVVPEGLDGVVVGGWFRLLLGECDRLGVGVGGEGLRLRQAWCLAGVSEFFDRDLGARLAGVDRGVVLGWRRECRVFGLCWDLAVREALDRVVARLYELGVTGVVSKVWDRNGVVVGERREFSVQALGLLMRGLGGLGDGEGVPVSGAGGARGEAVRVLSSVEAREAVYGVLDRGVGGG